MATDYSINQTMNSSIIGTNSLISGGPVGAHGLGAYGTYTINSNGTGNGYSAPSLYYSNVTTSATSPNLHVKGDAEFEGDITFKGKSLLSLLEKIEDRLAILQPDPKKLEKHAALRKAYEHYKLMEKLVGDD